jgi:hypothetical protein
MVGVKLKVVGWGVVGGGGDISYLHMSFKYIKFMIYSKVH